MNPRSNRLISLVILTVGIVIYWGTAYPSITWWDSSEYSTAAACLGITGPPGSLLMTFLGWLITPIHRQDPALVYNMLSGVVAALTMVAALAVCRKMLVLTSHPDPDPWNLPMQVSLVLAAGIIFCSSTLWEYAIMFTPYILTALFTMLILLALLNWWKHADETISGKNLFLIALLIGLDFNVHRTNAVLIPGILLVLLIRKPSVFRKIVNYLIALGGLICGLSLQLLYIPLSLRDPLMNMGETNSLQSLWNYISLKQYGGNFLMDILVRKGPLWSYQFPYYFKGFARNFFFSDHLTAIGGYLPVVVGLAGMFYLSRRSRRLGLAMILFFLITVAVSVIYFNLPENYFRTIYRHYLPTFVIFSVFILTGAFYLMRDLPRLLHLSPKLLIPLLWIILGLGFLAEFHKNLPYRNGSSQRFTVDHAENILRSVAPQGILFNYYDNNFFPELYLQIAEKQRTDITHCNMSLLNLEWYIRQVERHDAKFPAVERNRDFDQFVLTGWEPERADIPISETVKNSYHCMTDTFRFVLPAIRGHDTNLLQDVVVFDVIRDNRWKRPIYFVKDGLEPEVFRWLRPWLSDEGLLYRLRPDSLLPVNYPVMVNELTHLEISGFDDPAFKLDDNTRKTGLLYCNMFLQCISHLADMGKWQQAASEDERMRQRLPLQRLKPDSQTLDRIRRVEERIRSHGMIRAIS